MRLHQKYVHTLHVIHFWFHIVLSVLVIFLATRWIITTHAATTQISLIIREPPPPPYNSNGGSTDIPQYQTSSTNIVQSILPPQLVVTPLTPPHITPAPESITTSTLIIPIQSVTTVLPFISLPSSSSSTPVYPKSFFSSTTVSGVQQGCAQLTIERWLSSGYIRSSDMNASIANQFIQYLHQNNLCGDYNNDGQVDAADLSIMMYLWKNGNKANTVAPSTVSAQGWINQWTDPYQKSSFVVDVMVDTAKVHINAFDGTVVYPSTILHLDRVDYSASDFLHWTKSVVETTTGTLKFTANIPTPGIHGVKRIIRFYFTPTNTGDGIISVTSSSKAFMNDGRASILPTIWEPFPVRVSAIDRASNLNIVPVHKILIPWVQVTSPTHPQSSVWYSSKNIILNFATSTDTVLDFVLDQNPNTTSTISSQHIYKDQITFHVPRDGIWYAHITPRFQDDMGSTVHFPLWVDSQSPILFVTPASLSLIHPAIEWQYKAQDTTSGIFQVQSNQGGDNEKNIYTDGSVFLNIQKNIASGSLVAMDRAGNTYKAHIQILMWVPAFFYNPLGLFILFLVGTLFFALWCLVLFHGLHPHGKMLRPVFHPIFQVNSQKI